MIARRLISLILITVLVLPSLYVTTFGAVSGTNSNTLPDPFGWGTNKVSFISVCTSGCTGTWPHVYTITHYDQTSGAFSGTGVGLNDSATEVIRGTITPSSNLTLHSVYTKWSYSYDVTATRVGDGTFSGTLISSQNQRSTVTLSPPKGSTGNGATSTPQTSPSPDLFGWGTNVLMYKSVCTAGCTGEYDHIYTITVYDSTTGNFSGTGTAVGDPSYTEIVTGHVSPSGHLTWHVLYTGANKGYTYNATATRQGFSFVGAYSTSANQHGTMVITPTVPGSCPSPWTCADIGHPASLGDQRFVDGTWTISGGGADIWGGTDQFHYVWQPVVSDSFITAHITSQTLPDISSKAGVMLRQNADPNAPNYYFLVSSHDIGVAYRAVRGGDSTVLLRFPHVLPTYVGVRRQGDTFTAYTSTNGKTWSRVPGSTMTISMGTTALAGLAVTVHNDGALSRAAFDHVSIQSSAPVSPSRSCPQPWTCADIGNPVRQGGQKFTNGAVAVWGGGADIWGNSDQFHYVAQSTEGDQSISARITAQDRRVWNRKAGVMIRADAAPNAPNYYFYITPKGVGLAYRTDRGGATVNPTGFPASPPTYLKVGRRGNEFTAYTLRDGSTWTVLPGSHATINMPVTALRGLAVTAYDANGLSTATFDHVSIQSSGVAGTPPTPRGDGSWPGYPCLSVTSSLNSTYKGPPPIGSVPNFDPLRAPDKSLKCYGFPERPQAPAEQSGWTSVVASVGCWVSPGDLTEYPSGSIHQSDKPQPSCSPPMGNRYRSTPAAASGDGLGSTNVVETPGPDIWGGYSAAPDVSGARRYKAVLGSWVQQGEGAQDGHVIADWVGLGGANGDDQPHDELFQNGSEVFDLQAADYAYFFDMTHDLHNPKVWCQPKANNHAINACQSWLLKGPKPQKGDTIAAYTQFIDRSATETDVVFGWINETRGWLTTYMVQAANADAHPLASKDVEWVIEDARTHGNYDTTYQPVHFLQPLYAIDTKGNAVPVFNMPLLERDMGDNSSFGAAMVPNHLNNQGGFMVVPADPPHHPTPHFLISPKDGSPPGSFVTIRGLDFTPNKEIFLGHLSPFELPPDGLTITDKHGVFNLTLRIPSTIKPGRYTISANAIDQSSSASTTYAVTG